MPLLCAVSVLAAAFATSGSGASTLVVTVNTLQGATTTHAHPPAGGTGDTSVSSLLFINGRKPAWGKGPLAPIGSMTFTYTIRSQCTSFGSTCTSTADIASVSKLPDGTITASGKRVSISSPTIKLTVTNGTRRYAGARGTLTMGPSSTKTNIYRLTLP